MKVDLSLSLEDTLVRKRTIELFNYTKSNRIDGIMHLVLRLEECVQRHAMLVRLFMYLAVEIMKDNVSVR